MVHAVVIWEWIVFQVQHKEIDFFIREPTSEEKLLAKENVGLYPPRISVFFVSTPANTTLSGGRIEFKGAEKRLSYDIFLAPGKSTNIINCDYNNKLPFLDEEDRVHKKRSEFGKLTESSLPTCIHRSDSTKISMEQHSYIKTKNEDNDSSRPLSVPIHGSDPNELSYSVKDDNTIISESHIQQRPQTLDHPSPVMEQTGEAFPTVPEIRIVSPDNEPIVESSGYIEEFTSQNDDAIATSDLTDVIGVGRKFTDKANDFSLEIPVGAIPEGERLTVDLGVALSGRFEFPKGLRLVSPVFLICAKKESQFCKPVLVTIPHFLNLTNDDDITSLGLTFLKADHNKNSEGLYEFKRADRQMIFEPHKRFGVLHTTHFCSVCIACIDNLQSLEKTTFCITSVLPNTTIPVGRKAYGYFFLTFLNLRTCLRRLDEIIKGMNLVGYDVKSDAFEFKVTNSSEEPALEMTITQPEHGIIGVNGTWTVSSCMIHAVAIL